MAALRGQRANRARDAVPGRRRDGVGGDRNVLVLDALRDNSRLRPLPAATARRCGARRSAAAPAGPRTTVDERRPAIAGSTAPSRQGAASASRRAAASSRALAMARRKAVWAEKPRCTSAPMTTSRTPFRSGSSAAAALPLPDLTCGAGILRQHDRAEAQRDPEQSQRRCEQDDGEEPGGDRLRIVARDHRGEIAEAAADQPARARWAAASWRGPA